MAAVTLRFVHSGGLVARLIRMGEDGFAYQHVECLTPDGALVGAHIDGGVLARANGYDAGRFEFDLYVRIPCTRGQADAYHAFLAAQIGKPYDRREIAEIAVGVATGVAPNWIGVGSWICSELQTKAALAASLIASAVEPSTPRDCLGWCAALTEIAVAQP
jgi:hypothetical protein